MKRQSMLQQAYNQQMQNIVHRPKKTIPKQKGNLLFFLQWLLIGGSTSGIALAVLVVLYVRKKGVC